MSVFRNVSVHLNTSILCVCGHCQILTGDMNGEADQRGIQFLQVPWLMLRRCHTDDSRSCVSLTVW